MIYPRSLSAVMWGPVLLKLRILFKRLLLSICLTVNAEML